MPEATEWQSLDRVDVCLQQIVNWLFATDSLLSEWVYLQPCVKRATLQVILFFNLFWHIRVKPLIFSHYMHLHLRPQVYDPLTSQTSGHSFSIIYKEYIYIFMYLTFEPEKNILTWGRDFAARATSDCHWPEHKGSEHIQGIVQRSSQASDEPKWQEVRESFLQNKTVTNVLAGFVFAWLGSSLRKLGLRVPPVFCMSISWRCSL